MLGFFSVKAEHFGKNRRRRRINPGAFFGSSRNREPSGGQVANFPPSTYLRTHPPHAHPSSNCIVLNTRLLEVQFFLLDYDNHWVTDPIDSATGSEFVFGYRKHHKSSILCFFRVSKPSPPMLSSLFPKKCKINPNQPPNYQCT